MFESEFEFEAITPIFMGGADQSRAEIRASSIKGLMRWWFRALAGSYFGDDVEGLRKAEEYVFGSTGRKSGVIVEISDIKGTKHRLINKVTKDKRGKIKPILNEKSMILPLPYLFFPIKMYADELIKEFQVIYKGNVDKINTALNYENIYFYPPKTKFKIVLTSYDEKAFKLSLLSLWTLLTLGGIGFRNRRGMGCLKITDTAIRVNGRKIDLEKYLGIRTTFKTRDEFKISIENAIENVGNLLKRAKKYEICSYPVLSEISSSIGIVRAKGDKSNSESLLKMFEEKYSEFRRRINRDVNRKKSRMVFGLPFVVRKRIRNRWITLLAITDRRASPIIVGIIEIGNEQYLRIVKFRTKQFHPKVDSVNWGLIHQLGIELNEEQIFGSLEVFK
jgi:CRISPR-associated protein Cmr1